MISHSWLLCPPCSLMEKGQQQCWDGHGHTVCPGAPQSHKQDRLGGNYFPLCCEGEDREREAPNPASCSPEGGLTIGANRTSECGSVTGPTLLLSPRKTEGTLSPGLSTRFEGGRREKAGAPCLETRGNVSSREWGTTGWREAG